MDSGISEVSFKLRRMHANDLALVFKWRNHKSIRTVSETDIAIPMHAHISWFNKSHDICKWIFEVEGKPNGVFLFDRSSSFWSFYVAPGRVRRRRLSYALLSSAVIVLTAMGVKTIKARVKHDNKASQKLHQHFGFEWFDTDENLVYTLVRSL